MGKVPGDIMAEERVVLAHQRGRDILLFVLCLLMFIALLIVVPGTA